MQGSGLSEEQQVDALMLRLAQFKVAEDLPLDPVLLQRVTFVARTDSLVHPPCAYQIPLESVL